MPKFHQTKKFIELDKKWKKKLKAAGFDDIEDENENLRVFDQRTKRFRDRRAVAEFVRRLGFYLAEHSDIPKTARSVLELYCEGLPNRKIAEHANICPDHVRWIIRKFRRTISVSPQ